MVLPIQTPQPIRPAIIHSTVLDSHPPFPLAPHPWLQKPILFFTGLHPGTTDENLANGPLRIFRPVRIFSVRHLLDEEGKVTGSIEFQTQEAAEKALATLHYPRLLILPPPSQPAIPAAKALRARFFPFGTTGGHIYDIFRPFGPLDKVSTTVHDLVSDVEVGISAKIQFYHQEDAEKAQRIMSGIELEGKIISVSFDETPRITEHHLGSSKVQPHDHTPAKAKHASKLDPRAPVFTPSPRTVSSPSPLPVRRPESRNTFSVVLPVQLDPNNGPIVPVPGTSLQYVAAGATYVDPCNLFCKHLDPMITDEGLYAIFRNYGPIVSARVMTDEFGRSREHGFVSFTKAEDAARALQSLDGAHVGSKRLCIRLHEPKTAKKDKLARRRGVARTGYTSSPDSSSTSQVYSSSSGGIPCGSNVPLSTSERSRTPSPRPAKSERSTYTPPRAPIDSMLLDSLDAEARESYISDNLYRHIRAAEAAQTGPYSFKEVFDELKKLELAEKIQLLINDDLLSDAINAFKSEKTCSPLSSRQTLGLGFSGATSATGPVASCSQNLHCSAPEVPSPTPPEPSALLPANTGLSARKSDHLLSATSDIMPDEVEREDTSGISELLAVLPEECATATAFPTCLHVPAESVVADEAPPGVRREGSERENGSNGDHVGRHDFPYSQVSKGRFVQPREDSELPNDKREEQTDSFEHEARADGGVDNRSYSITELAEMSFRDFLDLVEAARRQKKCDPQEPPASSRISLPTIEASPQVRASVEALLEESIFSEPREEKQMQKLTIVIYGKVRLLLAISGFPRPRDELAAKITADLLKDGDASSDDNHEHTHKIGGKDEVQDEEHEGNEKARDWEESDEMRSKSKGKGKAKAIDYDHQDSPEDTAQNLSEGVFPDDDYRRRVRDSGGSQTLDTSSLEDERKKKRQDYLRSLWCVAFLYESVLRHKIVHLAHKEAAGIIISNGSSQPASSTSIPTSQL